MRIDACPDVPVIYG